MPNNTKYEFLANIASWNYPIDSMENFKNLFDLVDAPAENIVENLHDFESCTSLDSGVCSVEVINYVDECVYGCGFGRAQHLDQGMSFFYNRSKVTVVLVWVDNVNLVHGFLDDKYKSGHPVVSVESVWYESAKSDIDAWSQWYLSSQDVFVEVIRRSKESENVQVALSKVSWDFMQEYVVFDTCEKKMCLGSGDFGYCSSECGVNGLVDEFDWGVCLD